MANEAPKAASATPKVKQVGLGAATEHSKEGRHVVRKVDKFGAASKAGILVGDEIASVGGTAVAADLTAQLQAFGVGATIKVVLLRKGKATELSLTLLEKRKALALDIEEVDEVLERKISP